MKWFLIFLCIAIANSTLFAAEESKSAETEQVKKKLTPEEAKSEIKKTLSEYTKTLSSHVVQRKKTFELRHKLTLQRQEMLSTLYLYDKYAPTGRAVSGVRLPKEVTETAVSTLEKNWEALLATEAELDTVDNKLVKMGNRIAELQELAGLPVGKGKKSPTYASRFKYILEYYTLHTELMKTLMKIKTRYESEAEELKGKVNEVSGKQRANPKDKKLVDEMVRAQYEVEKCQVSARFIKDYMDGHDERVEVVKDIYTELGIME